MRNEAEAALYWRKASVRREALGYAMGSGYRFGMANDGEVTAESLNALLTSRNLSPYTEAEENVRAAEGEARESETGAFRLNRAFERLAKILGRSPVLQLSSVLVPRPLPAILELADGTPVGSLDAAWTEWLLLGQSLGALPPGADELPADLFRSIQAEDGIDAAEGDEADLIEERQAWLCFYEGLRVARARGLALRHV